LFSYPFLSSYAILVITRFELVTLIEGAGVPAASSTNPLTARTDTEKQQPLGTVTIAVEVTLLYSSTAAGVTIAREVGLASPFTAIETAIDPAVPPSGTAIFPLNVT
jgi:hypothetical protein